MEVDDSLSLDKRRLGHAWACVLPQFFQLCVDHSRTHGAGVSVFRMLSTAEKLPDDETNCIFHFVTRDSPSWGTAMTNAPNKENILAKYDPVCHVIIAVHIPAIEGQNSTVGNVRLFEVNLKDDKPVEIE